MRKKQPSIDPNEKLKIEAAMELGLLEKAQLYGWDKLTAQETGKIGAMVKKMLKRKEKTTP
ncbi:MAG: small, acid-soluble spore protein, alpha/beta type [Tepidanaerobacteraceae bacterium]|jgi:small acid-soluble spore protein F (minor alpha/beta-type SASP)